MFASALIANRGEIACRVIRAARKLGLRAIAICSPADRGALFTRLADETHELGDGAYLDIAGVVALARKVGADCVHPGYGFLAENADFADACVAANVAFVGPSGAAMRAIGLKHSAKALMQKIGAPVVSGYHGDNQTPKFLKEKAYEIGYPVVIKAVAGGGGRGMRRVDAHAAFDDALDSATREATVAFGDGRVLIEKYIAAPRHVEIQIVGDRQGNVVHLFERDCSAQRRHQKIVEASPAPGLPEATLGAMAGVAVAAAKAVGYVGAGTVEFILDSSRGLGLDSFYFLEMNARLQVEHPVTEEVTGLDLVEWQFRVAAGEPLPCGQDEIRRVGAAIEARLCAEDPENGFLPSPGEIVALSFGGDVRVETGVEAGDAVSALYDSMIAKLIAKGETRAEALDNLKHALAETVVAGPKTNLAFLRALLAAPKFSRGAIDAGFVDAHLSDLGATRQPLDVEAALAGASALRRRQRREQERPATRDPWDRADAFDLLGPRRVGFEALVEGNRERFVATTAPGGEEIQFADGRAGQAMQDCTIVEARDVVYVLRGGRQTRVAPSRPHDAGEESEARSGDVIAPMHGRLIAVDVADGAEVKKGQRVAVVEAMKMEHALHAPFDGRVADLSARAGDGVEQGTLILRVVASSEPQSD